MSNTPEAVKPEDIPQIVNDLRAYFKTNATVSIKWREAQLNGLIKCLYEHEQEWTQAMYDDMGSHMFEARMFIGNVVSEIQHTLKNLKTWLSPESLSSPWALTPGETKVVPEPYGVVCDFIPYNYPVYLGFSTLLPIIASGNVCLFKPSSNTPACAKLYQELFPKYLDTQAVRVICGPTSICDIILDQRFDFIFYTGSPAVGKIVMRKAAEHLTPVLLELGGKSPVYIDKDASMSRAARRLILAKMTNGGQTCVAPDYCLVHKDAVESFRAEVLATLKEFYGDAENQFNDNITHIISRRHYDRICSAVDNCQGQILFNGYRDPEKLYIGPTFIESPSLESQLMKEEIFGPVLPFVVVNDENEAISFINDHEKPLSCYVFTTNDKTFEKFRDLTSSGALLQNDATFHVSSPYAPFGGVGNSGMGQYHGPYGIKALSHWKPCFKHYNVFDISKRNPPYTESNLNFILHFA